MWQWRFSENAALIDGWLRSKKQGQPLQTNIFETPAQAEQWAHAIEVEMDTGVFVSRVDAESATLKALHVMRVF